MKCSYKLNTGFDFIKNDDLLKDPKHHLYPEERWLTDSVCASDYLTKEMQNFLKDIDVSINSYMGEDTMSLFRGQPNGYLEPHIDRGTCWAINYITGTDKSEMIWYNLKEGVKPGDGYEIPTFFNPNATYHAYHNYQLEEIDRSSLIGLCLVRIDIPHSIHNYDGANPRFCFSLKDAKNKWSWNDVVNKFSKYIIYE